MIRRAMQYHVTDDSPQVLTKEVCQSATTIVVHRLSGAGPRKRIEVDVVTSKISVNKVDNCHIVLTKSIMAGLDLFDASDIEVDAQARVGTIQLDPPLHNAKLRVTSAETAIVINLGAQGADGDRDYRGLLLLFVGSDEETPCVLADEDGNLHPGLPAAPTEDTEKQYVVRWKAEDGLWTIGPVGRSPSGWPLLNT